MAICHDCDQEMITATSCLAYGEVDESIVQGPARCHDCGVKPGGVHHPGCDMERCSVCGGQWIACGHEEHDGTKSRWLGEWPGKAECRALGFYCRDFHPDGRPATPEDPLTFEEILHQGDPWCALQWHVPCGKDDPGAHEDLNRLAIHQARTARA